MDHKNAAQTGAKKKQPANRPPANPNPTPAGNPTGATGSRPNTPRKTNPKGSSGGGQSGSNVTPLSSVAFTARPERPGSGKGQANQQQQQQQQQQPGGHYQQPNFATPSQQAPVPPPAQYPMGNQSYAAAQPYPQQPYPQPHYPQPQYPNYGQPPNQYPGYSGYSGYPPQGSNQGPYPPPPNQGYPQNYGPPHGQYPGQSGFSYGPPPSGQYQPPYYPPQQQQHPQQPPNAPPPYSPYPATGPAQGPYGSSPHVDVTSNQPGGNLPPQFQVNVHVIQAPTTKPDESEDRSQPAGRGRGSKTRQSSNQQRGGTRAADESKRQNTGDACSEKVERPESAQSTSRGQMTSGARGDRGQDQTNAGNRGGRGHTADSGYRGGERGYRGGDGGYRGGERGYRGGDRGYRGGECGYRGGDRGYRGGEGGYRGGERGYRGGDRGYRGGECGYRGGERGYRGGDRGYRGGGGRGGFQPGPPDEAAGGSLHRGSRGGWPQGQQPYRGRGGYGDQRMPDQVQGWPEQPVFRGRGRGGYRSRRGMRLRGARGCYPRMGYISPAGGNVDHDTESISDVTSTADGSEWADDNESVIDEPELEPETFVRNLLFNRPQRGRFNSRRGMIGRGSAYRGMLRGRGRGGALAHGHPAFHHDFNGSEFQDATGKPLSESGTVPPASEVLVTKRPGPNTSICDEVSNADTSEWVDDDEAVSEVAETTIGTNRGQRQLTRGSRGGRGRGKGRGGVNRRQLKTAAAGDSGCHDNTDTSTVEGGSTGSDVESKEPEGENSGDAEARKKTKKAARQRYLQRKRERDQAAAAAVMDTGVNNPAGTLATDVEEKLNISAPPETNTEKQNIPPTRKEKKKAANSSSGKPDTAETVSMGNTAGKPATAAAGPVDENALFWHILKEFRGRCFISDLAGTYFPSLDTSAVLKTIESLHKMKIRQNKCDVSSSVVFVFIKRMRICANAAAGCRKADCIYLHLCPAHVAGWCTKGDHCRSLHNVRDACNAKALADSGLADDKIDESLILLIARTSNLAVCPDYKHHRDHDNDSCIRLHICNDFIRDRCLIPDDLCEHQLESEHNLQLVQLYEMRHMVAKQRSMLLRLILSVDPENFDESVLLTCAPLEIPKAGKSRRPHRKKVPAKAEPESPVEEPEPVPVPVPMPRVSLKPFKELIAAAPRDGVVLAVAEGGGRCEKFEKHECDGGTTDCEVRHETCLSYLWRVKCGREWTTLDDSQEVEEKYSMPFYSQGPAKLSGQVVTINFDKMDCIGKMRELIGKVQRLSTASYVDCRDKTDATRWRWYWNNGLDQNQEWIEFKDSEVPFQDVLESKFLFDRTQTCCFEIGQFQYELDFSTMTQTNMVTKKRRNVCRRPIYVNEKVYYLLPAVSFHFHRDALPFNEGWSPMDTETPGWSDLIPLNPRDGDMRHVYQRVTSEFYSTLSTADYQVHRVYRVQNLALWRKYVEQKSKMEKLLQPGNLNERSLFHGTSDEKTVRCICHQNFDPRMHGRNGTLYGKGSYFSTTAKYSNSYTQRIGDNGHRFMFFARVLVGRSEIGKPDYARPNPVDPSRPHGQLYDSCVNQLINPSIIVVFDNEHCYPEFLIEYKDLKDSSPPLGVRSRPSFSGGYSGISQPATVVPSPYVPPPAAAAPRPTTVPVAQPRSSLVGSSAAPAAAAQQQWTPTTPSPAVTPTKPRSEGCSVM